MCFGLHLSEDPETLVLLLERGMANDTCTSRILLVSANILNPATGVVSWYNKPIKHCDGRRDLLVCGEVLGGLRGPLASIAWLTLMMLETMMHGALWDTLNRAMRRYCHIL